MNWCGRSDSGGVRGSCSRRVPSLSWRPSLFAGRGVGFFRKGGVGACGWLRSCLLRPTPCLLQLDRISGAFVGARGSGGTPSSV